MKQDVLEGRTSSTNRAFASERTIKISDSIATTFGSEQLNSDASRVDLSQPKTVIDSTSFALPRPSTTRRHHRNEPQSAPDVLGLTSNSDKTGSGEERDLSYRTMVETGLTFTGFPSVEVMAREREQAKP
jgi:hypothetical protein